MYQHRSIDMSRTLNIEINSMHANVIAEQQNAILFDHCFNVQKLQCIMRQSFRRLF